MGIRDDIQTQVDLESWADATTTAWIADNLSNRPEEQLEKHFAATIMHLRSVYGESLVRVPVELQSTIQNRLDDLDTLEGILAAL